MSTRTKKILKITAVALAVVFVGLLIYNWFFKKTPTPPAPATNEEFPIVQEGTPASTKERLIALTDETVLASTLATGNKIFYVSWDGSLMQMNTDGSSKEKIASLPQERIGEINFSQNGQRVIVKQVLSSGTNRYLMYDTSSKAVKTLPANTETAVASPDGTQIITVTPLGGIHQLILNNDDLTKSQNLITTKIPDLSLDWTNKNFVILKTKPSGLAYGLVYTLYLKTKKTQRILGNTYGLTANLSPSGKKLLFSQTDSSGRNLKLNAFSLDKKTETALDLFSLPEKCVWAQDDRTIYCASINSGTDFLMPDDYYKRKLPLTNNDLVKINLDLGQTQKVISGGFDPVNLTLSPDEAYLFFINKIDGRLYRLTL